MIETRALPTYNRTMPQSEIQKLITDYLSLF